MDTVHGVAESNMIERLSLSYIPSKGGSMEKAGRE